MVKNKFQVLVNILCFETKLKQLTRNVGYGCLQKT